MDRMFTVIVLGGAALGCGGATSSDLGGDASNDAADASSDAYNFPEEGFRAPDSAPDVASDAAHDATRDAGTFACGTMLTCNGATEVCKIGHPGVPNAPIQYDCVAIPTQCASNPTCACIEQALAAQACHESSGDVTVEFYYP